MSLFLGQIDFDSRAKFMREVHAARGGPSFESVSHDLILTAAFESLLDHLGQSNAVADSGHNAWSGLISSLARRTAAISEAAMVVQP